MISLILVDGDSCPVPIRALLERIPHKRNVAVHFLANRPIPVGHGVTFELVVGTTVDERILAIATNETLVVTRDIPLAEQLVQRNIIVLNDRGREFTPDTVGELRSLRDAAEQIRAAGLESMDRRRTYGHREATQFANTLDRVLTRENG